MSLIALTSAQIVELKKPPFAKGGMLRIDHATHYGVVVGTYSGNPGTTGAWTVSKVSGAATVTTTKDSVTSINVYKHTDNKYYIQNTTAGTVSLCLQYQPVIENSADL